MTDVEGKKTSRGVELVIPYVEYLDVQAGRMYVEVTLDEDIAASTIHAIADATGDKYRQGKVESKFGRYDVPSTDKATAVAARFLARYPDCRAEAYERDAWNLPDGGTLYGPWEKTND